mmetsp:Transcript_32700/g.82011  ORF Transcript_32700/g.82011 Transcript_32700/m.82011 type:complete len:288 (+) Transcript_32700:41-904(+)
MSRCLLHPDSPTGGRCALRNSEVAGLAPAGNQSAAPSRPAALRGLALLGGSGGLLPVSEGLAALLALLVLLVHHVGSRLRLSVRLEADEPGGGRRLRLQYALEVRRVADGVLLEAVGVEPLLHLLLHLLRSLLEVFVKVALVRLEVDLLGRRQRAVHRRDLDLLDVGVHLAHGLVEERQDLVGGQVQVLLDAVDAALLQAQHQQDGRLDVRQVGGQPLCEKGVRERGHEVQDQVVVHQVAAVGLQPLQVVRGEELARRLGHAAVALQRALALLVGEGQLGVQHHQRQ